MKRLAGFFVVIIALAFTIIRVASAQPPDGFESQTLILGLDQPTGLTFAPDGRMFITERTGAIKIVPPGAAQVTATPLLTLTNINTDQGERGLVGMALDLLRDQWLLLHLLHRQLALARSCFTVHRQRKHYGGRQRSRHLAG